MKNKSGIKIWGSALLLAWGLVSYTGCAPKTIAIEESANEAISRSRRIMDEKQRLDYLIFQARGFLDKKQEFEAGLIVQEAMKVDKWNTPELDMLARQAANAVPPEVVETDRAEDLPQEGY